MNNTMTYKNYTASIHYSDFDEIFYGKIEGITDSITFEGDSVRNLKKAFHKTVDEYIEMCVKLGKDIQENNIKYVEFDHSKETRIIDLNKIKADIDENGNLIWRYEL